MRLSDLRPGWGSDCILHRHGGVITERDDCVVVRTPANPHFYWGNCLLLPRAPRDGDLAFWLDRFDDEVVRHSPASQHVAIGINDEPRGDALPSWLDAGFERIETAVIAQGPGELRAPLRRPRGAVQVAVLDLARDLDTAVDLQCVDAEGFEPVAHKAHRRAQMQRIARMETVGQAHWFGVWCDGVLAADCGLVRDAARPGATARFQHVSTHPQWRRRGLCTALIHHVTHFAFTHWGAARTVMCADPEDVAITIYESLGYRRIASEWGLQLRAPQDRLALAP